MSNKELKILSVADGYNIYESDGEKEKLIAFMPDKKMLTVFLAKKEIIEAFGEDAVVFID